MLFMFLFSDNRKWQADDETACPESGAFPAHHHSEQHVLDFSIPKETPGPAVPSGNLPDPTFPIPQHVAVCSTTPA